MDTSTYTHLCRAGSEGLIEKLAPGGVVLIPTEVDAEIARGCDTHADIPAVSDMSWAKIAVLTEDEHFAAIKIKAALGGGPARHVGESAVIACAHYRGLIAVLDDRAAVEQADFLDVPSIDTLWIVMEAYKTVFHRSRTDVVAVVNSLLGTGMYLPFRSGEELFAWAYVEGLLP